ncbi:hypothetical protein AYO21_03790 [Fonsecaea monophora]|uniref:Uncharacterized protein n=1 Tax=Fonsecaea monophora TaxID=254056 RepID=A0A177FCT7_9EURO|nr:hypothetical protein AYO21_03790 [Fonsecaea monophora]OAG42055.1 hypothetical protein AYO21_03790 [Fonsecaea monophora]
MSAPRPTSVRMREKDAHSVYFCENSCRTSYSGCLDEDLSMTEQEIAEFIRYSNPGLYERLNGVRLPSSYVAPDDTPGHGHCLIPEAIVENGPASLFSETDTTFEHATGSVDADCPSELDHVCTSKPESRPAAEPIVLADRYHFTFYQHSEPGVVYCCSSPTCPNPRNVIPLGNYFGIIRDEAATEGDDQPKGYNRIAYYCLDCLDEVVDREEQLEQGQKAGARLVDGAQPDRNVILHKALGIYPELDQKEFFFVRIPSEEASEVEPGDASNSKKATRLRRQKQLEIHRIAQDLRQQQLTTRYRMYFRKSMPDPSGLRILGPLESQPYRDRYRKQGLEWIHRLEGSEVRRAWNGEDRTATTDASAPDHEMEDTPVCYCREPADEGPMLRCLSQLPLETEDYRCGYCMSATTRDKEQGCEGGQVGNCTHETENEYDTSGTESDNEDSGGTIRGQEESDNEDEDGIVPSAPGFIAVNHVSSQGKLF